jgi:hypothetical protein
VQEPLEPVISGQRDKRPVVDSETGGAEPDAVGARNSPLDIDLSRLIDVWPTLPESVRYEIAALIRSSVEEGPK